jgi:hypothetical protein
MTPLTNPPSPEPTRVEIQYRLTPEQEQLQRKATGHVLGLFRVMVPVMLLLLVVFLVVAGVVVFLVLHIASSLPLP